MENPFITLPLTLKFLNNVKFERIGPGLPGLHPVSTLEHLSFIKLFDREVLGGGSLLEAWWKGFQLRVKNEELRSYYLESRVGEKAKRKRD